MKSISPLMRRPRNLTSNQHSSPSFLFRTRNGNFSYLRSFQPYTSKRTYSATRSKHLACNKVLTGKLSETLKQTAKMWLATASKRVRIDGFLHLSFLFTRVCLSTFLERRSERYEVRVLGTVPFGLEAVPVVGVKLYPRTRTCSPSELHCDG